MLHLDSIIILIEIRITITVTGGIRHLEWWHEWLSWNWQSMPWMYFPEPWVVLLDRKGRTLSIFGNWRKTCTICCLGLAVVTNLTGLWRARDADQHFFLRREETKISSLCELTCGWRLSTERSPATASAPEACTDGRVKSCSGSICQSLPVTKGSPASKACRNVTSRMAWLMGHHWRLWLSLPPGDTVMQQSPRHQLRIHVGVGLRFSTASNTPP